MRVKSQTFTVPVVADCDDDVKDRLFRLCGELSAPELAYAIAYFATELERR